jgi:hypothetical protein
VLFIQPSLLPFFIKRIEDECQRNADEKSPHNVSPRPGFQDSRALPSRGANLHARFAPPRFVPGAEQRFKRQKRGPPQSRVRAALKVKPGEAVGPPGAVSLAGSRPALRCNELTIRVHPRRDLLVGQVRKAVADQAQRRLLRKGRE